MGKLITCKDCKQIRLHNARGLCNTCYTRWWVKKHPKWARRLWRESARRQGEGKRIRNKLHQEQYSRENIEYIKSLKPIRCEICGYDKCFAAIEFHHIDPSIKEGKGDNVSRWINLRPATFKERFSKVKLQILCANCHRELHAKLVNGAKFYYEGG